MPDTVPGPPPLPASASEPADPARLDITAESCPMTFVRTRLALDRLGPGRHLLVRLRGDEPLRNVSANVQALGHALLRSTPAPDGSTELEIRTRGAAS
ncbi:MAG: sulfurtransferase TusA family protein [Gluconacetobacter diazotrophicus]|nr:sulfurtransferase TusA family protein [Gluconacetobacter diazotrophicus]